MRRFSNDWIDRVSMTAMWRAVFRNKGRIESHISNCQNLLHTVERVHFHTRRVFNTLARMEEQIFAKARRGRRTIKIRGRILSIQDGLQVVYRRRRYAQDRLADIQRCQDLLYQQRDEWLQVRDTF